MARRRAPSENKAYAPAPQAAKPASGPADKAAVRVLAGLERARRLRAPHESRMQECLDYALPNKETVFGSAAGQDRMTKIFDETAVVGVQEFASRMQAGLLPPFSRWMKLESGADVPEDQREDVDLALEGVVNYLFDLIHESNLNEEIVESLLDVAVGTGFLEIEEGDVDFPFVAKALPIPSMWIDVGPDDRIDTFYREHRLRVTHLRLKWPRARIPQSLITVYEKAMEGGEDPVCCVIECVRRDYSQPNEERWVREVVLAAEKAVLFTEDMQGEGSCPIVGFRWSKMAGEVWGRGPLQLALPAIKTCNLTIEMILENADMAIAGMYTAEDDGVVNPDTIRIVPGTIIPIAPGSGGLKSVEPAGNFDVAQLVLTDMRTNIKRALYNELMASPGKTPFSATEIAERQADLARQIGAAFGRLMHEMVQPIVRRLLYILRKQKLVDLPTVKGRVVKVRSTSPLARAQEMQDVSNTGQFAALMTQMFGPQLTNLIMDAETAGPYIARKMAVPKQLLRTKANREELIARLGSLNANPEDIAGNGPDPNQPAPVAAPGA